MTDDGDQGDAAPNSRTRQIVVSVAFVGTIMVELVGGPPTGFPQWLLLVVGAALLALVAGEAVLRAFRWILRQIRGTRRVLTVLSVGLTLALVYLAGPPILQLVGQNIFGCKHATELTVLTSPSGLIPSTRLAEGYERWTAERNLGCSTVNAYVYAAADADTRSAIGQGWVAVRGGSNPLRDVGPRPDVWLPDSSLEVNRLDEQAREDRVVRDDVVAVSPVVLGVRSSVADELPAELTRQGLSWPAMFEQMMRSGTDIVRPDPRVSTVGGIATAALYGDDVDGNGDWIPDPPVFDPRAVEQWIGRSLDRDAYPLADSTELLCRYRQLNAPQAAMIMSEQDLVRFNRGSPLGGGCGAEDRPRAPAERMIAFYPRTVALDHRFVDFTWTTPGSVQAEKVAEFKSWLTGEQGRGEIEEVGLRAPDAPLESALLAEPDALPTAAFDPVLVDPQVIGDTIEAFLQAQRRSRVLLALDVSGSMAEPASTGSGTRLSAVTEGIRQALAAIGPRDELGLWLFPGDSAGLSVGQVIPVGPPGDLVGDLVGAVPRTQAVSDTLGLATPAGNTPLFRAMVDGVAALGPGDDITVNKLVVITDGEDTTSGLTPQEVLDGVRGRDVRVFVVAIGETSCAAAPLEALAGDTGGGCYPESPSAIGSRLVEIISS